MRVQPGLLGLLAAAPLHRPPCRLSVFPDSEPAAEEPSGNFDGPNPQAVTGFWTIYDELAMEDSMNRAARQEPDGPNSMMSASIASRASPAACDWPICSFWASPSRWLLRRPVPPLSQRRRFWARALALCSSGAKAALGTIRTVPSMLASRWSSS